MRHTLSALISPAAQSARNWRENGMKKLLTKLRTTAARWRTRCFEALGFIPSAELYAMREAYNDELRERLILKRDYENLYEDYHKALETPVRHSDYVIVRRSGAGAKARRFSAHRVCAGRVFQKGTQRVADAGCQGEDHL